MAQPRNLAISQAHVAYKLEVLHKPGQLKTVAALPANSFLTLESTRPSSLTTGPDGDVTEQTLQTFTYVQTKYDLDSNQKPKKIELPAVQTSSVSGTAIVDRVRSSFIHKEDSESKIEISNVLSSTSASKLNMVGDGFHRTITETFSFTPSETREEWESSNQTDAILNAVMMRSDITVRESSEIIHDANADKKIKALITSNFDKLHKSGGVRKIKVVGDVGAKYTLVIKNSSGNTYDFNTNTFVSGRSEITNPETTLASNLEIHLISLPVVTSSETYKVFLEPSSGTTAASGIATDENSANSKSQLVDVTFTFGLTESTGSDWSSIASNITSTKQALTEAYRTTAIPFSLTATSAGKVGTINRYKFNSSQQTASDWIYYARFDTVAYNHGGSGANVLTVAGNLYIEKYGVENLTHQIDLDELVTIT